MSKLDCILNKNHGVLVSIDDSATLYIDSVAPLHELLDKFNMTNIKDNIISSMNTKGYIDSKYFSEREVIDNANLSLSKLYSHMYVLLGDKMTTKIYKDIKDRRIVSIYGNDHCNKFIFVFNIDSVNQE